jgi:ABC-2 type transport system ATP-binding protein
MVMEATIEVAGLRKRFGPTVALDGMSFTVAPGQVTGFVGPNGAGKSTTTRVILGLDAADAGTALIGDPPALMLDEPFNGLDPEGIVWMRGLLRSLAAEGRAVLVSSHLMSELQDTALRTTEPAEAARILGRAGAEVTADGPGLLTIRHISAERAAGLLTRTAIPFTEVNAHHATLEEAYLRLTSDAAEHRAAAPEVTR